MIVGQVPYLRLRFLNCPLALRGGVRFLVMLFSVGQNVGQCAHALP